MDRAARGNPACIQQAAIALDGSLDVHAFHWSVNEIVQRHAALRTTFPLVDGRPVRRLDATRPIHIEMLDRESISEAERDAELQRQASEEARRPFDLDLGPLIRASLTRFGPSAHALLLTAHAAAFDDGSVAVFMRELGTLYEAASVGAPLASPAPPVLDTDTARHGSRRREDAPLDRQLSYWKEHLSGDLPVLNLATDLHRPQVPSFRGASASRDVPPALVEALEDLSRRAGVAFPVTVLSVFTMLLHRYTEQDEILIGVPSSGRGHVETRDVIGRLEYPLVVRACLRGDPTFQELIRRIAEEVSAAEAHGDVPFGALLEALGPARDTSRHPLFQAAFALRREPSTVITTRGVRLVRLELERAGTETDLALSVRPGPRGLLAAIVYSADLFEPEAIDAMLAHLHLLLAGVADDPDRPISAFPLLTPAERHRMVVEWNDTRTAYPESACIHELFQAQVERSPAAIAATCGGGELTYGELNRRANRLAHRLIAHGVRPDLPVGVFVERSLDMLVGLLGILKAGGAYVPLDPEYPDERLRLMLRDVAAPILVGRRDQAARLSFEGTVVDRDEDIGAVQDERNPTSRATARDLAYVMFTSGSTGQPKGVAVPHRAVVRLVTQTNYVTFGASDRVTVTSSLSFDASTFEIWGPLINGARAVVVPHDVLLSPKAFADLVCREGITSVFLTTALFHHMASLNPRAFQGLSCLVVGGDTLNPKWAREVLENGAPLRLVNGYGPTENTTFSTAHVVQAAAVGASSVPIGRPISNTRVYVLDRHLRPVPVGVAGELYVGGDGLSRGYVNRPELTAEHFIKSPFPEEPGPHLYRTGDRVRYLRDGAIEFLGRIDAQVKIRGFRVEIGEVEAALAACPTVRDAVVMVREDVPGDKRLVAYVVSSLVSDRVPMYNVCQLEVDPDRTIDLMTKDLSTGGVGLIGVPEACEQGQVVRLRLRLPGTPGEQRLEGVVVWRRGTRAGVRFKLSAAEQTLVQESMEYLLDTQDLVRALQRAVSKELRAFLKTKLPEHLMPSTLVMMRALPISPIGKVDRRALPAPGRDKVGPEPTQVGSPVEEQVAKIWAEVLEIDRVEVHDDFFELGGNSLLAARMLLLLEEVLRIDLPVRCLFESPTVAGVARAIHRARLEGAPVAAMGAAVDLRSEAVLDPDIRPGGAAAGDDLRQVLLTGASGFLGAFLLSDLLGQTRARIHCLVRSSDPAEGLARIQRNLETYGLWDQAMSTRIAPVPGDLAKPLLGLGAGHFERLAEQIGAIYHCGAAVSYVKPYESHKAANVLGTQEILRLACRGPLKPLHYISTIGVLGNIGYFTGVLTVREEDDLDASADFLHTDMGYSQSKWVAEKLVWIARSRGVPVTIFRPGFIMGHSKSGLTNVNDFVSRMISGCIRMGYYPDLPYQSKEFIPADVASKAIVHLSRRKADLGKVFHLVPPPLHRVDLVSFFEALCAHGYPLKRLTYAEWRHELVREVKRSPDNPLLPFLPMLTEKVHGSRTRWEMQERMPVYDCNNTLEGLAGTAIVVPRMDDDLLNTYLSYYIRSGFLEPPRSRAQDGDPGRRWRRCPRRSWRSRPRSAWSGSLARVSR
jgi:amino acid adenylation domain-containing protein/thioester reductase-like protein